AFDSGFGGCILVKAHLDQPALDAVLRRGCTRRFARRFSVRSGLILLKLRVFSIGGILLSHCRIDGVRH
ncbi:MAG TPA: hypothetical protein VN361_11675, partial [Oxalicibacterium sp.]|nr:hypothetical protein [Oxalicibacterium sp.]